LQGEVITGHIDVKRNDKNPRDIDIHLKSTMKGSNGTFNSDKQFRLR
jgi:hypothetical protein